MRLTTLGADSNWTFGPELQCNTDMCMTRSAAAAGQGWQQGEWGEERGGEFCLAKVWLWELLGRQVLQLLGGFRVQKKPLSRTSNQCCAGKNHEGTVPKTEKKDLCIKSKEKCTACRWYTAALKAIRGSSKSKSQTGFKAKARVRVEWVRNSPMQAEKCVCVPAAGSVAGLCVTRRNTPVSTLRYGGGSRHAGACRLNNALYCAYALTADAHRRGSPERGLCVCVCLPLPSPFSLFLSLPLLAQHTASKFIYSTHVLTAGAPGAQSPRTSGVFYTQAGSRGLILKPDTDWCHVFMF